MICHCQSSFEYLPNSKWILKKERRATFRRGVVFCHRAEHVDITLTLPAKITHGSEVFVRALGKVVRVEGRNEDGTARMGITAVIERYDIIRGEAARA